MSNNNNKNRNDWLINASADGDIINTNKQMNK